MRYARSLRPNGAYVTVGGQPRRLLQALFFGPLISLFSKKRIRIVALKPNKDLNCVNELPWCINTGKSLIPLTLLFLAQKRNLLIPLELSRVMHQGTVEVLTDSNEVTPMP